tara:strand:+ start:127 stop:954 length:828 start_codon:yes stop_codon:yes gene_type:complete
MNEFSISQFDDIIKYYSKLTQVPFEVFMEIENELDKSIYRFKGLEYEICNLENLTKNRLTKEDRKNIELSELYNEKTNFPFYLLGKDSRIINDYYNKAIESNNTYLINILNSKLEKLSNEYQELGTIIFNPENENISEFSSSEIFQYFVAIKGTVNEILYKFNPTFSSLRNEDENDTISKEKLSPFLNEIDSNLFKEWIDKHKGNKDLSFFYYKIKDKIINCTQKSFIEYLFKNEFITEKNYNYYINNIITSLKNCTSQAREDNFARLTENPIPF